MPYEKALRPPPLGRGRGDVKPTPALPKGGGIMFFCPSVRVGVGFYLPSLGEGLGVGVSYAPKGH